MAAGEGRFSPSNPFHKQFRFADNTAGSVADWLGDEGRAKLAPNRETGIDFLEGLMNYEEPDELLKREEWMDSLLEIKF